MTTADTYNKTPPAPGRFTLPDPPPRHPDDMTSFKHLATTGNVHHLALHLGSPGTTLVTGERYVVVRPTRNVAGSHYPDMVVALDVDPAAYETSNGYIIAEQGKPPDFVLEIASRHTGHVDVGEKRGAYAALAIPEYWRFDETGQHHGVRLAGDRLVDGVYVPISIEQLPDGSLQDHSEVLDLHLQWEDGQLGWYDPRTGQHIPTMEAERQAREAASQALEAERQSREVDLQELEAAEGRAAATEAHARELETELRRLRNG